MFCVYFKVRPQGIVQQTVTVAGATIQGQPRPQHLVTQSQPRPAQQVRPAATQPLPGITSGC